MRCNLFRCLIVPACSLLLSFQGESQVLKEHTRYVLRSGDTLELKYRLTPEFDQTVSVQPDGFVSLKVAGDVHVTGLTVGQAHDAILAKDSDRLNDPELNLILRDFTPPSVVVAGEVRGPGKFELKENMTAWGAIMQSGGFGESAKSGQILIYRKVSEQLAEVHQLNFSRMNKTANLEQDMDLQAGDILYVPRDHIAVVKHYTSVLNFGASFDPTTAFRAR